MPLADCQKRTFLEPNHFARLRGLAAALLKKSPALRSTTLNSRKSVMCQGMRQQMA